MNELVIVLECVKKYNRDKNKNKNICIENTGEMF